MRTCLLVWLAACGQHAPYLDGGSDPEPSIVTIQGTLSAHGSMPPPLGTVAVSAKRLDDDATLASADASTGEFTMSIATNAGNGDVYLVTQSPTFLATYYNFRATLVADASANIDLFTQAAFDAVYTQHAVTELPGAATIEVFANNYFDDQSTITGPGTVAYDSTSLGYVLNAMTGTVSANDEYVSREIRVFSDAVSEIEFPPPIGGD